MKASELMELSGEELEDRLGHLREEFFNLKFQHATGQLENPMRLSQTKRDIARVLTILREKELDEA
ncbi:MAG: 50S ribosomal protein L29 [Desulfarculaceae bacterium]|jgi:large subunit ribosomal protein L29